MLTLKFMVFDKTDFSLPTAVLRWLKSCSDLVERDEIGVDLEGELVPSEFLGVSS